MPQGTRAFLKRIRILKQLLKDAIERIPKETDSLLALKAESIVRDLRATWPRDTGRSARGWRWFRTDPLRYIVVNPVPYTRFIYRKGDRTRRPIVEEELNRARRDAEKRISDQIGGLLEVLKR